MGYSVVWKVCKNIHEMHMPPLESPSLQNIEVSGSPSIRLRVWWCTTHGLRTFVLFFFCKTIAPQSILIWEAKPGQPSAEPCMISLILLLDKNQNVGFCPSNMLTRFYKREVVLTEKQLWFHSHVQKMVAQFLMVHLGIFWWQVMMILLVVPSTSFEKVVSSWRLENAAFGHRNRWSNVDLISNTR